MDDEMARKNKQLVSLLESLKQFKTIVELNVTKAAAHNGDAKDTDSKFVEGDMISGDFDFEGIKYSFIDRCSSELGLHRISCAFDYEVKRLSKENVNKKALYEAAERFDLVRIGIKSVIKKIESDSCSVLFCVDIISSGVKSAVDKDSISSYLSVLSASPDYFWDLYGRYSKEQNGK